jgi:hypothetical protein
MTDRRLPELIGICVVLQVTQCARSFGEGAGGEPEAPTRIREQCCGPSVSALRTGTLFVCRKAQTLAPIPHPRDRGEIFPARGQTEMHLINVWIVLAMLLGLLAVTRLLRYDDVSHYEVFSDGESVGRIAEPERVAAMPEQHIG